MQSCLEPLGQHWKGFSTVQCCPNSFKAALDRIFSYAMFSEAFQTTLHRTVTFAKDNISQVFLMQSCLEPLGQHCIGF